MLPWTCPNIKCASWLSAEFIKKIENVDIPPKYQIKFTCDR